MPGSTRIETADLAPGDRVGEYRLERLIGEGGMGIVFQAVRETDGRVVALKLLRRDLSRDEVYRHRFAHEARAARAIQHPHLVPILDAGEADGLHYLASQYVDGGTLLQRIKERGPLALDQVVDVITDVGSALDALHRNGLVHRDVKSANVMLTGGGRAALTDFGLAKGPAYTVLTKRGQVMGTIDYLAPELIRGETGSPGSDIYALGCVAYESVVGVPPFAHKSVMTAAMAHLEEDPPDPASIRPDLPPNGVWPLLSALAKDPARRPSTATAYGTLLRMAFTPRAIS